MKLQLIRSATLLMTYGGHSFVIDPYFADKLTRPSYAGKSKNPLVELPMTAEEILTGIEMVLVSHFHSDHFDPAAQAIIPKDMLLLSQPEDEAKIRSTGFTNVIPIEEAYDWNGVRIRRVLGEHGSGKVLEDMGTSSGFVFEAVGEPRLYWCGDTILCETVSQTVKEMNPDVIVTHSCGAVWGDQVKILMDDVQTTELCKQAPKAVVVATHMEAVDHATVTRAALREYAKSHGVPEAQLLIPQDGETLCFT